MSIILLLLVPALACTIIACLATQLVGKQERDKIAKGISKDAVVYTVGV